jgi:hypothetical protein
MSIKTFIILFTIGVFGFIWSNIRTTPTVKKVVERLLVAIGFHPYLEETLVELEEMGLHKCHTCGVYDIPGVKCCHDPKRS